MLVFENGKKSSDKAALITALSMLIMIICATFSVGVVDNKIFVSNDATSTFNNIQNSIYLFQGGILSWLIILICDILISWSLYIYFNQIDKSLALLGSYFRLIYSAILAISILSLIFITVLMNNNLQLLSNEPQQLKSLVMLFIITFHKMWSFGLIIFGIHLFIIGCLVIKSKFIPKIIGILLFIGSFGYMLIHLMNLLLPQYQSITKIFETILSLPMIFGELGLGIWLLIKCIKSSKSQI